MGALAAVEENEELAAKVDFTMSVVSRWSIEKVAEVADRVLALGREHAKALVEFGMNEAEIDELAATIKAYSDLRSASRKSVAERSVMSQAIPALVSSTTKLLRTRLNRQMNYFRRRDPVFFKGYRNARIILGPGQGTPGEEKKQPESAGGEQPMA